MLARREVVADEVAKEAEHVSPTRQHQQHVHHEGVEHCCSGHHCPEGEHHHHDHDSQHPGHHLSSSEGEMKKTKKSPGSSSKSESGKLGKDSGSGSGKDHLIEGRSPRIISEQESEESGIPPLAS